MSNLHCETVATAATSSSSLSTGEANEKIRQCEALTSNDLAKSISFGWTAKERVQSILSIYSNSIILDGLDELEETREFETDTPPKRTQSSFSGISAMMMMNEMTEKVLTCHNNGDPCNDDNDGDCCNKNDDASCLSYAGQPSKNCTTRTPSVVTMMTLDEDDTEFTIGTFKCKPLSRADSRRRLRRTMRSSSLSMMRSSSLSMRSSSFSVRSSSRTRKAHYKPPVFVEAEPGFGNGIELGEEEILRADYELYRV